MNPFLCQSVNTSIVLYKWLCPGALFWQRNYSLSSEIELATYTIKYFLYPHKLLRLQVGIFSADSIRKEFNTSSRKGLNCVTLPELRGCICHPALAQRCSVCPLTTSPSLLLCIGSLIFRVYGWSLQCWKASRILPSVVRCHEVWGQDRVVRQCSWEAGREGLVGSPAASALVCLTPA